LCVLCGIKYWRILDYGSHYFFKYIARKPQHLYSPTTNWRYEFLHQIELWGRPTASYRTTQKFRDGVRFSKPLQVKKALLQGLDINHHPYGTGESLLEYSIQIATIPILQIVLEFGNPDFSKLLEGNLNNIKKAGKN